MTDGLKDEHREAIIAAIAANDRVERAVLFGSRATGTNTMSSDVDIALFGDRLTLTDHAHLAATLEELPIPQSVDLLLYSSIQSPSLREHIRKQGIECYTRLTSPAPRGANSWFDPAERWAVMPFTDAFLVNPPVPIERDRPTPFVDMAAIDPSLRSVQPKDVRKFRGSGSRFQDGDTLMARITPCLENGKIARYCAKSSDDVGHGSTEFIVVRGLPEVTDTEYAFYVTRSELVRGYAIDQMTGTSGRQRVPAESLAHLDVSVPPLAEQRAIARFLGTMDDKIELNRQMNATLEAIARALFKSWFVRFEPVRARAEGRDSGLPRSISDLFPNRLVEYESSEAPEGWAVSTIGREVETVGGGTPSTKESAYWTNGEYCWATPKDLSTNSSPVLLETARKISADGVKRISSGLLSAGTVLMSSRAPIGYLSITTVPTAINQGFIAMVCNRRLPNLYVLFWCKENLEYIKSISGGSTFSEISKRTFRTVPIIVPSDEVIAVYTNIVDSIYDRIVANTNECATLAEMRDRLLPELTSGSVRLCGQDGIGGAAV